MRDRKDSRDRILVRSPDALTPAERGEVPSELTAKLARWPQALAAAPSELAWAAESLKARKPVIERTRREDGHIIWALRYPLYGRFEHANDPCFGSLAREDALPTAAEGLPQPLRWLGDTFGHAFVELMSSGTAPWGRRLGEVRDRMFDGVWETLPAVAANWWVLYETDGDWLAADPETGKAYWTGIEWNGGDTYGYPCYRRVLNFILWRLLDHGWISPQDLNMLFAADKVARA